GLCGSLHVASFRDTACTGIYTLSLHDALPICGVKQFMRVFTVILLIMVGTVFVVGPAKILDDMTGIFAGLAPWLSIVFIYYVASDRKSTRLNSSHVKTSYAVLCLKKKIYLPTG